MRIYDWHIAPNPRRLHIFLARDFAPKILSPQSACEA